MGGSILLLLFGLGGGGAPAPTTPRGPFRFVALAVQRAGLVRGEVQLAGVDVGQVQLARLLAADVQRAGLVELAAGGPAGQVRLPVVAAQAIPDPPQ